MTREYTTSFITRALRWTTRAVFTLALYGFAAVGVWYVGTTAALMQFGLTIEKAQQIKSLGDVLFETEPDLMPPLPPKKGG